MKDDVKKAFDKFDKDQSGAIDKVELSALCEELGDKLNEKQLEAAMDDLDMNEDGVIDMSEFSRWYFTGMKSFNDNKKRLLKLGKHSRSIFNKLAEKSKADLGKEITTKSNKMLLGFNRP